MLAGLGFVLTSALAHIAADMAYHPSVLVVLLAALLALVRTVRGRQRRARTAPGGEPDREGIHQ